MDINQVFGGEFLKATDLQGRTFNLVISAIEAKTFDDGDKLLLRFHGAKKALVCNRTNAKRIALLHGDETAAWIGQMIGLHAEMVDFKGEPTMAIRVVPPQATSKPVPASAAPPPPLPPLPANDFNDEVPF
jgi:hypothetical protein